MSITKNTVSEAYYLVRIGSWSEEDLAKWVNARVAEYADAEAELIYQKVLEEERRSKERNIWGYTDDYGRW